MPSETVTLDPTGDLLIIVPKWRKAEPEAMPAKGSGTLSEGVNGNGDEKMAGESPHPATSQGKPRTLHLHIILT